MKKIVGQVFDLFNSILTVLINVLWLKLYQLERLVSTPKNSSILKTMTPLSRTHFCLDDDVKRFAQTPLTNSQAAEM